MFKNASACDCSSHGSSSTSCGSNGKCTCKLKFSGNKCNSCKPGYYNYPNCDCKSSNIFHILVNYNFNTISQIFQLVYVTNMDLLLIHVIQVMDNVFANGDMLAKNVTTANQHIIEMEIIANVSFYQ